MADDVESMRRQESVLGLGKLAGYLVDGLVVSWYRCWHHEQILELLATPVLMVPKLFGLVPKLLGLVPVESVKLVKGLLLAHVGLLKLHRRRRSRLR